MPYTKYPIYYTNSKLGYKNQELYAQTLESTTFFERSDLSYGYYTSENKPVLNPTATDSPVPLAPWVTVATHYKWGLNLSTVQNSLAYLKPGLEISTYSSSKASDIALAGTRPVNTKNMTIAIPPVDFYPNGTESGATQYSAIDIVIYVSREGESTSPRLIVERQCFTSGSTAPYIESTTSNDIPDVPYFVFNFAVSAPGAPSTDIRYSFDDSTRYLNPGGGSGAGAQFTAILSTNPVNLTTSAQSHTDKITIRYTLAKQSYSSSLTGFDPSSISSESDNGIDVVKITADLHYTVVSTDSTLHYSYSRKCTLPGGLIYPGYTAPYSDKARTVIKDFVNYKVGTSQLVSSTFPTGSVVASMASALIFHKADWMLPELQDSLTNTDANLSRYELSHPFTVFNPEALFPSSPLTKIGTSPYTGAAGRPSIFAYGASPDPYNESTTIFQAFPGGFGAGGSGAIWKGSLPSPFIRVAKGGSFTLMLSW